MGIFTNQRERLLRTDWPNATMLAEELYTMFGSQEPIQIDSPLQLAAQGDVSPITITYGAKPADQPWVTPTWTDPNTVDSPPAGPGVTVNFPGMPPVPPAADSFNQPPPIAIPNGAPQIFTSPVVFANQVYVYQPTSDPFQWDGTTWPFDFPPPSTGQLLPVDLLVDPNGAIPEPFPIQGYTPGDSRQGPPTTIDKSKLPPPIGEGETSTGSGMIPAIYRHGGSYELYERGYGHASTGVAAAEVLNLAPGEELSDGFKVLLTKVITDVLKGDVVYYALVPVWMD